MDSIIEAIALLLLGITAYISYRGFNDSAFFNRYKLEVDAILINKQYDRLLTSGFLHANWWHLLFNAIALYSFSAGVGVNVGPLNFILIYFLSLLGGNLLSLFIHRQHGDYSAIGASGAISGIIFSFVVLYPKTDIHFFFLPFDIPAWLFGVSYMLISLYGIKSQYGNIGHDAHTGGAIVGIIATLAIHPEILQTQPLLVAALLIPFSIFMYLLATKPEFMLVDSYMVSVFKKEKYIKDLSREEEINLILDKINSKGIDKLTEIERRKLDEFAK